MITDEQIQEVVRLVKASFENTLYPGDDNIGVHHIDRGFKGKHWKDINLQLLMSHRDELGSLTPKAFRYYLPAFLLAVLQFAEKLDSFPDNLVYMLAPHPSVWDQNYDRAKEIFLGLEALNDEQKMAVNICLKTIEEVYGEFEWSDFQIYLVQAIKFWSQYVI